MKGGISSCQKAAEVAPVLDLIPTLSKNKIDGLERHGCGSTGSE